MGFPEYRAKRLRSTRQMRGLVREKRISVDDFIFPLFVVHGEKIKREIPSMPGNFHLSVDALVEEAKELKSLGIPAILLFGLPQHKDWFGSEAYSENGIVQKALRALKEKVDDVVVITDVCLCGYTTHGHCGVVEDGRVKNNPTLGLLTKVALSHAKAGADIVAPSAMMDGQVKAIRKALDEENFTNTAIMSYSVKYASAFYGPFREAAESSPQSGDRKSYQMDPSNIKEGLREVQMDIEEGADIMMVKPALAYLDLIEVLSQNFPYPMAAYSVSGEYAMVKAAAQRGWVNEKEVALEILTSIKRAGADMIITYYAKQVAEWLSLQS